MKTIINRFLKSSLILLVFLFTILLAIGSCSSDEGGGGDDTPIPTSEYPRFTISVMNTDNSGTSLFVELETTETTAHLPYSFPTPTMVNFDSFTKPSGAIVKDANDGDKIISTFSGSMKVVNGKLKLKVNDVLHTVFLVEDREDSTYIYNLVLTIGGKDYPIDFGSGTNESLLLPAGTVIASIIDVKILTSPRSDGYDMNRATPIIVGDATYDINNRNIRIQVRAADRSTKDYIVNIRAISQETSISNNLTLTIDGVAYSNIIFSPQNATTSTGIIELTTAIPSSLMATLSHFEIAEFATAADVHEANRVITEGGMVKINGSTINLKVTAEDKTSTKNYIITLIPFDAARSEISSLTLTIADQDYVIDLANLSSSVSGNTTTHETNISLPAGIPDSRKAILKRFTYSSGATAIDTNSTLTDKTVIQGGEVVIKRTVNDYINLKLTSQDGTTINIYNILILPKNVGGSYVTLADFFHDKTILTVKNIPVGGKVEILTGTTADKAAANYVDTATREKSNVIITTITEISKGFIFLRINGITSTGIELPTTPLAPKFEPRYDHASVVYDGKMWVMGGDGNFLGSAVNFRDVWSSSDGLTWSKVLDQDRSGEQYYARTGLAATVFSNKMWIIGGNAGYLPKYVGDVWSSSDGASWHNDVLYDGSVLPARANHATIDFKNKLWVIGGRNQSSLLSTDIWSSGNGVAWEQQTVVAPDAFKDGLSHHQMVSNNSKLWITSGINNEHEVWSSQNGTNWTQVTANPMYPGRSSHSSVAFNGKIWVIGGRVGSELANDVWSSTDGTSWQQHSFTGGFSPRQGHTSVVHDGKIWVIGGFKYPNLFNDIWYSSDGDTWTKAGLDIKTGTLQVNLNYSKGSVTEVVNWIVNN